MSSAIFTHARLIRSLQRDAGLSVDWERVLEAAYRRFLRPGHVAVDVGAHVGRHLVHLAALTGPSGRVLAFEPLPFAFQRLVSLGLGPGVDLHNCALADFSGQTAFVHAQGTPEESGLRERVYNHPELAAPQRIEVEVRQLDEFTARLDRLDFVKIDAEGGEIAILNGASATLQRFRPVVSVEYGRPSYAAYGHTADTLFRLAQRLDYAVCDLFGEPAPSLEVWRQVCDHAMWDWFLVPAERQSAWSAIMRPDVSPPAAALTPGAPASDAQPAGSPPRNPASIFRASLLRLQRVLRAPAD